MDKDDRFKHIATDPKFRRIPKSERKVKIDKRFQSMFSDDKFKLKYTVDKRGRPVNHTSTEDLKRYYELNSDEESDETTEKNDKDKVVSPSEEEPQLKEKKKGVKNIAENIKKKLKDLSVDYARGEGTVATDSSSDEEESEDDFSESEEVDHGWGEMDKDAERTEDATKRLAVCNQDWDRIRAVDIMVLFNSFVPAGGVIHSVIIYPSDFGIQRMKEEEVKGPVELLNNPDNEADEETEEGSNYHMEKLRQYQLNRLKYFYAVVLCDSAETANKIYTECDGMEYESSATKIDLRFIPEDMVFENEPKEICEKLPDKYEPRFFTTTALQHAKVELTWDETNPERLEITKKLASGKIDDVSEADLQAYLASSSEDESETEQNSDEENASDDDDTKTPIDKYRALLQNIENTEKEKDNKGIEMEISWGLNVKDKTEKLVKKKIAEMEDKTPFQEFLDKRKEKKKAKREERKKKQNKNSDEENSDDVPSDVDMNDPYFAEEFDKPEFKKKSKNKKQVDESEDPEDIKEKAELELLLLNENEDNRKHFNMKKIQEKETKSKKNKKNRKKGEETQKDEDNFQVNVKDDRFSALFSSHHYNIDPTDPRYKKTKAMEAIIEEKMKRRTNEDEDNASIKKKPKRNAELSVLVKSIKRKTQAFSSKK